MLNKKLLIVPLVCLFSTSSVFAGVSDVDQFLTDYEESSTVTTSADLGVTTVEPELLMLEDEKPTMNIEELKRSEIPVVVTSGTILSGTYLGNGVLQVGKTKVKVISKHLKHLEVNDQVDLNITGDIKSFKINSISKNGSKLQDTEVKVETSTSTGTVFEGMYLGNGKMDINGVIVNINSKKLINVVKDTKVKLEIEGTLKSFKIKKLEVL